MSAETTETTNISSTGRATVPALEKLLYQPQKVLDHGFIRLIDYMGDDSAIVQSARVSYGKGTKKVNVDRALIAYLMRHRHTTPFEMCEIKLHVKLPIFIARQWIRHRSANVNEYSARYSVLAKEFYMPRRQDLAPQSAQNNQGRDQRSLSESEADRVLHLLQDDALNSYDHYLEMLNQNEAGEVLDQNKTGIARELARMNLTLNYYTEWYWKIDLHNLFHFCALRADSHAQFEIQEYAKVILQMVELWVPMAYAAFMDYRVNSIHLSGKALKVIQAMLADKSAPTRVQAGIGKREWRELQAIFPQLPNDTES